MRTPITYYGGKQRMAQDIVSMIPQHKIYCEPFFGGGAVFFAKEPSYLEAINDTNNKLMTFYQILQKDSKRLIQLINNTPHSESAHLFAKDIYFERIQTNKLLMAWAVWQVTNASMTGSPYVSWKWCNGNAGAHVGSVLSKKRNQFSDELFKRIEKVQISCRDALKVIQGRDTEDTFFYLDPPYPGANQKHYSGYTFRDYIKLLELLQTIKGKFILSNYWSQTLRYYATKNNWTVIKKDYYLSVNLFHKDQVRKSVSKTEILVMNFEPLKEAQLQIIFNTDESRTAV